MYRDVDCIKVRKDWNRGREGERQKGRQGLNGWERTLCQAGVVQASGSMLFPQGQNASLMDTETIDLYCITGTHGIRLNTHTHTHTHTHRHTHTHTHTLTDIYILYIKSTLKSTSSPSLFIHASSLTRLPRDRTWGENLEHTCKGSVKKSNTVARQAHLETVCT